MCQNFLNSVAEMILQANHFMSRNTSMNNEVDHCCFEIAAKISTSNFLSKNKTTDKFNLHKKAVRWQLFSKNLNIYMFAHKFILRLHSFCAVNYLVSLIFIFMRCPLL